MSKSRVARWVAALALAASFSTWAGTGVPDEQLWTELDVIAPLRDKLSVTGIGQVRVSESLDNPTLSALGADLNYKDGAWTFAAGYRHQLTGHRTVDPKVTQIALLMATRAWQLGRSTVLIRARFEDTITASSNPYRMRVRAEYRWKTSDLGPISYLFTNDEVYYQFSNNEFFRNRFQAGMNFLLGKRTGLKLYYQRQDDKLSHPGAINALGLIAAITFD
ncbi:MAG TPA: DUF2490 domain-containing protein [Steroidobacteraceae bacterium]|nr:DUF2490 domain-containing protein [Steroidobacteraceae bacterium]